MASKVLADRQKSHRELIAWRDAHQNGIAQIHQDRFKIDPTPTLVPYYAAVEAAMGIVVETQHRHTLEKEDDPQHRQARDEAATETYEAIQGTRGTLEAVCGKASLAIFGLTDAPARDPETILGAARNFLMVYQTPGFKMPPVLLKGTRLDISDLVNDLEKLAERLNKALQQVKKEEGELQATQKAKDDAVDAYDLDFSGLINVLYGMCQLVGKKDIGELLPSLYRKRRGGGNGGEGPGGGEGPED